MDSTSLSLCGPWSESWIASRNVVFPELFGPTITVNGSSPLTDPRWMPRSPSMSTRIKVMPEV
jgi:hypothetical protein